MDEIVYVLLSGREVRVEDEMTCGKRLGLSFSSLMTSFQCTGVT